MIDKKLIILNLIQDLPYQLLREHISKKKTRQYIHPAFGTPQEGKNITSLFNEWREYNPLILIKRMKSLLFYSPSLMGLSRIKYVILYHPPINLICHPRGGGDLILRFPLDSTIHQRDSRLRGNDRVGKTVISMNERSLT